MMTAEEIAEVVAFLCSDALSRLTGINIPIEYGHFLIPGYRTT